MKKLILVILTAIAVSLTFTARTFAFVTADELIKVLKEKGIITDEDLKKIEVEQKEREEKSLVTQTKVPYEVFSERGALLLSSPQGYYKLRMRGYLHLDHRIYDRDSHNANSFDVRRGRFDFVGTVGKYIAFRIQNEMALSTPYLRNCQFEIKFWPWFNVLLGQYKPFFSTQWWTLDNQTVFLERASANPLYPFFDRGVTVYSKLFDERMVATFGIHSGAGMERDYSNYDVDDHKDYVGRLFFTPFKTSKNSWINDLHFCIGGTWGNETVNTKGFENRGFIVQNRQSKIWKWNRTTIIADPVTGLQTIKTDHEWAIGHRYRWGLEAHWIKGPFFISTEHLRVGWTDIETIEGHPNPRGPISGDVTCHTVFGGYFLTGEKMMLDNWGWRLPKPFKLFNPHKRTWGAWCPTWSFTYHGTDQELFDAGVLDGASRSYTLVVGLNWLWSNMIRWHFNYMYTHSGGGSQNGHLTGDNEKNPLDPPVWRKDEHMFGVRVKWTM